MHGEQMSKENPSDDAGGHPGEKGLFVGNGSTANYPALIVFLAGGLFGGLAVYDSVRRGDNYPVFLLLAMACALVSILLVMLKRSRH
jgi:hypothetical protein